MQTIRINLGARSYPVVIGAGALDRLPAYLKKLSLGTDAYIVTNSLVQRRCGGRLAAALTKAGIGSRVKLIPDAETGKSFAVVTELIRDLAAQDARKSFFVAAFGGGVAGDAAGFAASIYKRGIPFIQLPTTLLAQVDSSVGGKTAVDLPEGKNLVGSFYQPRLVISDVSFLSSLDRRQAASGLAEVIKYGMIRDPELFELLERRSGDILSLQSGVLELLVARCVRIKADVVERDEREEKGLRTILNFGHTIGHAIEKASKFTGYTHGEAVALGMLAAAGISVDLGLLKRSAADRLRRLVQLLQLPGTISGLSCDAIIEAHYRDKKFSAGRNRFVLAKAVGKTVIAEDVPLAVIRQAVRRLMRE